MDNDVTRKAVKPTQADRDMAAKALGYKDWDDATDYRLTGRQDQQVAEMVQAFAHHRIAALEALPSLLDQLESARDALKPFAAMGRVMEARARITFGKVPADSEIVCQSSGEVGDGVLVMGHFRDAAALLPDAPGWGGIYRPPFDRLALSRIT